MSGKSADATKRGPDYDLSKSTLLKAGDKISTDVHGDWAEGVTHEGEKFLVPKTADTVQAFFDPRHMNIATVIALIPISIHLFLSFVVKVPIWFNICWFLFFRGCYNCGLGWLLNSQSNHSMITHWYRDYAKKQPQSIWGQLFNRLVDGGLPHGTTQKDFPDSFNAWILYKGIVNISLVNDSTAYFILGWRCWEWPEQITMFLLFQYFIASLLVAFFCWAKHDAHRCIGTYCWYWGDFFYRKNVSLTFDGIFELFPHPMYTVGYAAYYACVLVTQSYTMLLCSLIGHMSQIIFLVIVEEPHIKKLYGDGEGKVERDEEALYDAEKGWFPSKTELAFFTSIDLYSSNTWMVFFMSLYAISFALLPESSKYSTLQVILWKLVQWGGIGYLLWTQSTRQMYTRYFLSQGRSLQEAFSHWKRIYNIVAAVNFFAFLACAYRHFPQFALSMDYFAKFAALCALTFLSIWTSYSTYHSIGDFGWFYGDFFIPPAQYTHKLCYTGIYRFLNNPDMLTGYAGFYGLGVFCEGWSVMILAALSHLLHYMFLHIVEIPHMKRIYGVQQQKAAILASSSTEEENNVEMSSSCNNNSSNTENQNVVREHGPLHDKVADLLTKQAKLPLNEIQIELLKVKQQGLLQVFNIYSNLSQNRTKTQQKEQKKDQISLKIVNNSKSCHISEPSGISVNYTTVEGHSETDWVGLYATSSPSAPGFTNGSWLYVPSGVPNGVLHFKQHMLPRVEGVYEFRYHHGDSYDVVASVPIVFTDDSAVACALDDIKTK